MDEQECESTLLSYPCDFVLTFLVFFVVLLWESIANSLTEIISTWWEYSDVVDSMNAFRRAIHPHSRASWV